MNIKKERESNFELMRLISIFFIIIYHILIHGPIMSNAIGTTAFLMNILKAIVIVHVNSLVFVTGYFSYKENKIKKQKIFKILGETWFYKISILLLFLLTKAVAISNVKIFEHLFFLNFKYDYWFINCYLVLILLSPYLNIIINKLNEKSYIKFIIILLIVFSIIPTISDEIILKNSGSSIANFILLYFIGAYFKKYPLKDNYHFKNCSSKKIRTIICISLLSIILIRFSLYYLGVTMFNLDNQYLKFLAPIIQCDFNKYSGTLVIFQTCLYCLLFESINIRSKIINFLARSVLGIYLFHDNYFIRNNIYDYLGIRVYSSAIKTMVMVIIYAIIIFIISLAIDLFRRLFIYLFHKFFPVINRKKQ